MCGRFVQLDSTILRLNRIHEFEPALDTYLPNKRSFDNFNLSPRNSAVTIAKNDDTLKLEQMDWGIRPKWAKKPYQTIINARSESLYEKPTFKSILDNRIIIPAEGFYEWKRDPNSIGSMRKIPNYIFANDGNSLLLAGLYEQTVDIETGELLKNFLILTTSANEMMSVIHDRMPVMLTQKEVSNWLSPMLSTDSFSSITSPKPNDFLTSYEVSTKVNNSGTNDSALIDPVHAFEI